MDPFKPFGPIWTHLIKKWLKWIHLIKKWIHLDPFSNEMVHSGEEMDPFDKQMGPFGPIFYRNGPISIKNDHLDPFGPIWTHLYHLDPFGPIWTHFRIGNYKGKMVQEMVYAVYHLDPFL